MHAGVVEWLMAPGCKPGGLTPYAGSNPAPCTGCGTDRLLSVFRVGQAQTDLCAILSGCSSVGRASAFQAEGREFESRRPLQSLSGQAVTCRRGIWSWLASYQL